MKKGEFFVAIRAKNGFYFTLMSDKKKLDSQNPDMASENTNKEVYDSSKIEKLDGWGQLSVKNLIYSINSKY